MHVWTKADIQECKVDSIASLFTSVFISLTINTQFKEIYALSALGSVGGRTSARRNPTGTIPGNQAMEQQAKRICKTKAINKRKN
jgi:hypothetical protein